MQAVRAVSARSLTAALACGVALAGCGDSEKKRTPKPVSQPVLQSLTCRDWQRLDDDARADVVAALHDFAGAGVTANGVSGKGTVLEDDQARRLFDGYCRRPFARSFSLYKLYGQAAGFSGHAP